MHTMCCRGRAMSILEEGQRQDAEPVENYIHIRFLEMMTFISSSRLCRRLDVLVGG